MKVQFELEYMLNSSPKVLFTRLSTAEGLAEWFADDVQVNGDIFSFFWDDVEHKAQLVVHKDNNQVRFKWTDNEDEDSMYFEFRLNIDELTGDVALLITDFAEEGEQDDSIHLWDSQITELRKVLGL
ncbi:MAG: SRPBCC domain-containing protein [Bacteroidia bacterium]|nr:MAG: SRPBCC domain-containing protein [Bacteroidia bacterium]